MSPVSKLIDGYIAVMQVSDGRITHFREYLNPLAVMAAIGKS